MAVSEASDASIVDLGVPEAHRTMAIEKVFWSHFSPNFNAPTWMIGLLIAAAGLDLWWGLLAIIAGNVIGVLPTAFSAMMGPATGLTQIENSRFAFGRAGTRLPASINYVMCVGWVAVGNVPATLAVIAMFALAGIAIPFWLALAALAGAVLIASVYGHHVVQLLQKFVGYVLVVAFGIIVVAAFMRGGVTSQAHHAFSLAAFLLGFSVVAANTLSWAPYSSDYTRYVAKSTSPAKVFWLVFVGLAGSSLAMELFGFVTTTGIIDTTPAAFIADVARLSGALAPVVLLVISIGALAGSTINTTTASYSLISAGVKIPRPVSAVVASLLAYALAVIGEGSFTGLYTNYLILLLYWISPWIGIVLADWFLIPHTERFAERGWRFGATIFAVVTPVTILLFSSTDVYTGPIAKLLGGIDVGYFVGFFVAGLAYVAAQRISRLGVREEQEPAPQAEPA
ncbi:MAG: cytosine permease [Candidatus Lustribacter sp.]|jgi:NCS1 family nucleobase:cation symporter-1